MCGEWIGMGKLKQYEVHFCTMSEVFQACAMQQHGSQPLTVLLAAKCRHRMQAQASQSLSWEPLNLTSVAAQHISKPLLDGSQYCHSVPDAELLKAQFRQDLLQEASVAADDRASSEQGTSTSGQSSR